MDLEINYVLASLARSRPIFFSEADFQHALAWEVHVQHPSLRIRLEKQVAAFGERRMHLDLMFETPSGKCTAIELKYKTRSIDVNVTGEHYRLRTQGAPDHGRYDFLHDIERLEEIVSRLPHSVGYAILLTNDPTYWTPGARNDTSDAEFRLHEGRQLSGEFGWGPSAGQGTTRGREAAIRVAGTYGLGWRDYSEVASDAAGRFRYLVVKVARSDSS